MIISVTNLQQLEFFFLNYLCVTDLCGWVVVITWITKIKNINVNWSVNECELHLWWVKESFTRASVQTLTRCWNHTTAGCSTTLTESLALPLSSFSCIASLSVIHISSFLCCSWGDLLTKIMSKCGLGHSQTDQLSVCVDSTDWLLPPAQHFLLPHN